MPRRGVEIEDHYGVSSNAGLLVFFGYLVMDGPLETRGVRLELSPDAPIRCTCGSGAYCGSGLGGGRMEAMALKRPTEPPPERSKHTGPTPS